MSVPAVLPAMMALRRYSVSDNENCPAGGLCEASALKVMVAQVIGH